MSNGKRRARHSMAASQLSQLAQLVAAQRRLRILPGDALGNEPNTATLVYPQDEMCKLPAEEAIGRIWQAAAAIIDGTHAIHPYDAAVDAGVAAGRRYGKRVVHPNHLMPIILGIERARLDRCAYADALNLKNTFLPPPGEGWRQAQFGELAYTASLIPETAESWWTVAAATTTLLANGLTPPATTATSAILPLAPAIGALVQSPTYDDLLTNLGGLARDLVDAYIRFRTAATPPKPSAQTASSSGSGSEDDPASQNGGEGNGDQDRTDGSSAEADAAPKHDEESKSDQDQAPCEADADPDGDHDEQDVSAPDDSDDNESPNAGATGDMAATEDPTSSTGGDGDEQSAAIERALDELAEATDAQPDTRTTTNTLTNRIEADLAPAEAQADPDRATWADYRAEMGNAIARLRSTLIRYLERTEVADRERGPRGRLNFRRLGSILAGTSDDVFVRRSTPGDTSVDIELILDISGSMGAAVGGASPLLAQRYHAARALLVAVVEALRTIPGASVGLTLFDDRVEEVHTLSDRWTEDACEAALARIIPRGGTDLNPALTLAVQRLARGTANRRVAIIATDGCFGAEIDRPTLARIAAIPEADYALLALDTSPDEARKFLPATHISSVFSTDLATGIEPQLKRMFPAA